MLPPPSFSKFLLTASIQEILIPKAPENPQTNRKPSWASTSTSEFSEKDIFSWFNSNCTILQTQTHEKQSGNRKCTTALVLYKIIIKKRLDRKRHSSFCSHHSHFTADSYLLLMFSVWPFHPWKIIRSYYNKNCYEHHKVSSKFYKNILPLCTIALWHIVCQQNNSPK